MKELREIIANNISDLRNEDGITQSKLAQVLNYSDKAVSKWERGESLPDVTVLKRIADYFGVTVDYLLTAEHQDYDEKRKNQSRATKRNNLIITGLAFALVWFVATFLFVELNIAAPDLPIPTWIVFIYAVPVAFTVLLVFNSIWGVRKLNYLIISVMVWTALLTVYMTLYYALGHNLWLIFILGIPAELIILLWSGFKITK